MTDTDPRVYSLSQVANLLAGVSVRTVQRLVSDGELSVSYLRGKPVVKADELAAYIDSLTSEKAADR